MTKKLNKLLTISVIIIVLGIIFNLLFWVVMPMQFKNDTQNLNFIVFLANQKTILLLFGLPVLIINILFSIFIVWRVKRMFRLKNILIRIISLIFIVAISVVTLGLVSFFIIVHLIHKDKLLN